jgi:hypothetical protein
MEALISNPVLNSLHPAPLKTVTLSRIIFALALINDYAVYSLKNCHVGFGHNVAASMPSAGSLANGRRFMVEMHTIF